MYLRINDAGDYKAALYIRLSKEDDGGLESQSVTNQKSLLVTFAQQNGLEVYDIYIDDGWSGTSFARPGFQRMINDIEQKKVNMVITKDMSRLGRDYIQTGYYMERYFPENRVRYLSLLDGIDTGVDSTANDITPFKAVMNDWYAKDISKKIKSVKHDKQRKGLFIGGKAAYGYRLSKKEKNKLVIDAQAAAVVRRMFMLALSGQSCRQIAARLNQEKVPTPAAYAGLASGRRGARSGLWSAERIAEILQNPLYIGHMAQGKSRRISYKTAKSVRVSRKNWIVVKNTHEPIIDETVFQKVGRLIASRRSTRNRTYDYLLKGIVRCHECGQPLAVINRPNAKDEDVLYFICRTYQRFTKDSGCTCHCIRVDTVTDAVLQKADEVCRLYLYEEKLKQAAAQMLHKMEQSRDIQAEICTLDAKIGALTADMDRMYLDKLAGVLQQEDFLRIYARGTEQRCALAKKRSYLQTQQIRPPQNQEKRLDALIEQFLCSQRQNRELLVSLIDRVELTQEKQVLIYFRFLLPDICLDTPE